MSTNNFSNSILSFAESLRKAGYVQYAEKLESKFALFKQAQMSLYSLPLASPKQLSDFAHRNDTQKSLENPESATEGLEAKHNVFMHVVNKQPIGKYAEIVKELNLIKTAETRSDILVKQFAKAIKLIYPTISDPSEIVNVINNGERQDLAMVKSIFVLMSEKISESGVSDSLSDNFNKFQSTLENDMSSNNFTASKALISNTLKLISSLYNIFNTKLPIWENKTIYEIPETKKIGYGWWANLQSAEKILWNVNGNLEVGKQDDIAEPKNGLKSETLANIVGETLVAISNMLPYGATQEDKNKNLEIKNGFLKDLGNLKYFFTNEYLEDEADFKWKMVYPNKTIIPSVLPKILHNKMWKHIEPNGFNFSVVKDEKSFRALMASIKNFMDERSE